MDYDYQQITNDIEDVRPRYGAELYIDPKRGSHVVVGMNEGGASLPTRYKLVTKYPIGFPVLVGEVENDVICFLARLDQ